MLYPNLFSNITLQNLLALEEKLEAQKKLPPHERTDVWEGGLKRRIRKQSLKSRFESKIEIKDGHWMWRGTINKSGGYGAFWIRGKSFPAHRVAYTLKHRFIPEGMVLDHVCRVPNCVNPDHLEPVTQQENMWRGVSIQAKNHVKTHCKRGHFLGGANLYSYKDAKGRPVRACNACMMIRQQKKYRKIREAKIASGAPMRYSMSRMKPVNQKYLTDIKTDGVKHETHQNR